MCMYYMYMYVYIYICICIFICICIYVSEMRARWQGPLDLMSWRSGQPLLKVSKTIEKTKNNQNNQRGLAQSIAKPLRKPKNNKKKHRFCRDEGSLARAPGPHVSQIYGVFVFVVFSMVLLCFVASLFGYFVFCGLLNGFAMLLVKPLWLFCFLLFSQWFCYALAEPLYR